MIRLKFIHLLVVLFTICIPFATSCSSVTEPVTNTPSADNPLLTSPEKEKTLDDPLDLPLYLNIIIHVEEDIGANNAVKSNVPDYDGNEKVFRHFSGAMRKFARIAAQHGAMVNFGTEWTFARGVAKYGPSFFTDLESMGHSIDAHAHETHILYHEVRSNIIAAGGNPTSVASGMTEKNIYKEMHYFDTLYPEFCILWGVASSGHGTGEPVAGWVWRPSGTDWEQHGPYGNYINIGGGEGINSIDAIKDAVAARQKNLVNTYSVFLNPRHFKAAPGTTGIPERWTTTKTACDYWENRLGWWNDFFTQVDTLVMQGTVQYASLSKVAEIFEKNELLLRFPAGAIPRSNAPATQRNTNAGYCLP